MPVSRRSARRQRLPFVARNRRAAIALATRAPARRRRCRAARPAPALDFAARDARCDRAAASGGIADGSLRRARSRPARARPIPRRERRSASHRPGSTTIPSGIRATRATSAATAGAAVVMPAATVKPAGGSSLQRSAMRVQQPVAPLGEVDRAALGEQCRASARRSARSCSSDCSQCRASSGVSATASRKPARLDLLDQQAHRACARGRRRGAGLRRTLRRARRSRPASAVARAGRSPAATGSPRRSGRARRRSARRARGRRSGSGAAAAARQPLARTNASVTVRTARLLGSRIRPRASAERVLAEARDQPGGKRVGERAVRRDGEDRRPARGVRHSRAPLPSAGSTAACRRRTTVPGGPRRSSGLRRSPGPTGCWSRTALRARLEAAASRPSGCR